MTTTTNFADDQVSGDASDWSTFAALSDIDTAGFKLLYNGGDSYLWLNETGTGKVVLHDDVGNGIDIVSGGGDIGLSASNIQIGDTAINGTAGFVSLTASSSFGIHNNEAGGPGCDINLLSDSGSNVLTDSHGTLTTKAVDVSGTDYETLFWSKAGNPCVFSIESDFDQNGVFCFESFDDVIANFSPHFLRAANSHDIGIGIPFRGNVWNCSAVTGNMSFTAEQHYFGNNSDDGSGAIVQMVGLDDGSPTLSVGYGPTFFGGLSDDGTGATVQITGSLSINGVLVTAP